jgi:hypothetical protein
LLLNEFPCLFSESQGFQEIYRKSCHVQEPVAFTGFPLMGENFRLAFSNLGEMSDLRRDSGFGMLEVIFVVIVMSMAAIAITKMTSDTSKMTAFVSGKNSRENVIQTVLLNTDCAASFPSVPGCSDGQSVNLVSKVGSGAFVIRADGTSKLSGYSVRARCVYQPAASNYGLDIRVAQLSSPAVAGDPRLNFGHANGTSFRREEVSGLSLSWSHPKAALFSAPSDAPCAAAIGGTTVLRNFDGIFA